MRCVSGASATVFGATRRPPRRAHYLPAPRPRTVRNNYSTRDCRRRLGVRRPPLAPRRPPRLSRREPQSGAGRRGRRRAGPRATRPGRRRGAVGAKGGGQAGAGAHPGPRTRGRVGGLPRRGVGSGGVGACVGATSSRLRVSGAQGSSAKGGVAPPVREGPPRRRRAS